MVMAMKGYYRICQNGPRNRTAHYLTYICLCLVVWLCIKTVSGNMVLTRLLQIGTKYLTVYRMKIVNVMNFLHELFVVDLF